jgi:hypothetical protein
MARRTQSSRTLRALLVISLAGLFECQSDRTSESVSFPPTTRPIGKVISPDEDHRPRPTADLLAGLGCSTASIPDEYWLPPNTSASELPAEQVPISLESILQLALTDTSILRNLGGRLVSDPRSATGVFDPAITATDPNFGIEAALAQFDANLSASFNHANNDDVFNNSILGGGATEVVQDLTTSDLVLQKVGATGTQYRLRNNVVYDSNNNPFSAFPSSYSAFLEAQMRQGGSGSRISQYFLFQERLLTALNGVSRSNTPGVLQAESNLRRLLGLPQNDGRLIRPDDDPVMTETVYDWYSMVGQAMENRIELKQQAYQVRKRELELLASRNFTLPRLDAVAAFRNNGFGDDLTGGSGRFSSALKDMASGDHNEWELGMQLNIPIGFRQAYAGVRNDELKLMREKAILLEQQKQIIHELGSAVRQTNQTYASMQLAYNRVKAARDVVAAREAAFQADTVPLNFLLEGQRRLAEAEIEYYRSPNRFPAGQRSPQTPIRPTIGQSYDLPRRRRTVHRFRNASFPMAPLASVSAIRLPDSITQSTCRYRLTLNLDLFAQDPRHHRIFGLLIVAE